LPEPSRTARIPSRPAPSSVTLAAVAVSTDPVPQLAAPPGYWVPVRTSQFAADGAELAGPSKPSVQTVVQSPSDGAAVLAMPSSYSE
jgi:hypothetical protein